ncbi:MAG TPA: ABC transporter substrate-binding protein [Armatimonadaceae bacterium]|nr:ABC transporter substrate-binding protein [Armatimonadaceae bacterium]
MSSPLHDSMADISNNLPRRAFLRRAAFGAAAAGVLLGGSALAGCSPGSRRQAVRDERDAKGRRVLHFWNGFTGPDGKTMEKLVRRFREENPDLDVRMQIIPWGTYYDKLTLAFAFGGAPHVCVVHAARLPEFAAYDALQDLGALGENAPRLQAANFAPVPWRGSFWDGKQYALPLDVHPICLYYNRKLFREAGLDAPPRTWDEFLAAAKALTRDNNRDGKPEQWGYVFTWQRTNFLTYAAQFGGGVLTPDLERPFLSSEGSLTAARTMRSLITDHKVAPVPEGVDAWLAFRTGRVGMALEGIYMQTSLEEQKGLDWAAAPAPQFGPERGVWGGSHLLAQPRGIPEDASRDAWRLMTFLSDHSVAWAAGGQVPARRDLLATPEFAALPAPAQAAKQLDYVAYEPPTPRSNAIFPFVDPAIESVLLGRETPERAFADADRRVKQVLDRP